MTPNQVSVAFTEAGVCRHCKRVLIYPHQKPHSFVAETGNHDALKHPARYRCHVVHLNRQKSDDSIQNLRLFCPSCAAKFRALTRPRPIHTRRRKYV